jgi:SulP family sulfate permease
MIETIKRDWFSNIRGDILSGIVVALALIPEALAFAIIAGVDPMVSLYASFCIAIIISFVGGRSGMISAATGAMALLMMPLVKEHGLNYLLAATILTGVIQLIFGICKVASLMKFIPRAVMLGFVNALGILIFITQLPHIVGISGLTYLFVAITLAIVYILPRYIKVIPAPLIAIVLLTAVVIFGGLDLRTVGDMGNISQTLPTFFIPDVPFNLDTLLIILPYSFALAIVGLLESLLTSSIIDDMTDTSSNKNKEARGQGIANFITGFFGGMAGCAMIGQSIINMKSGGRGRLSTFVAGAFLMFLIIVMGDLVLRIPMPVLAGIMVMVAFSTFDWSSFRFLRQAPKTDVLVMLVTIAVVLVTHDLSLGVIVGVLFSAIFFVAKISKIKVSLQVKGDTQQYKVEGQLFFASTTGFIDAFDTSVMGQKIIIDFSDAHIWDDSAVSAVDKLLIKYRDHDNTVTITGLNASSKKLVERIAMHG